MNATKENEMKLSPENSLIISGELSDMFIRSFKDAYAEKYCMQLSRGIPPLESQKNFIEKNVGLSNKEINNSLDSFFEGLIAFLKEDHEKSPIIPIFRHLDRLINISSDLVLKKTHQEILDISNEDYLKLYNLAEKEFDKKSYQTASSMFFLLIWLNPTIFHSQLNFGLSKALQGNHKEAEQIYEVCLLSFPEEPLVYVYAADNFYMMGDDQKAKELLELAMQLPSFSANQSCLEMAEQLTEKLINQG